MKASLQVSVRALVELSLRAGDLNLESRGGPSTLDAIRAHQKVQASRPDGYRKEVRVSRRFERDGFVLDVSGRIDGVWEREAGPLIEEIKTTQGDVEERPVHWGQLQVYAYIVATERELSSIDTRLTCYRLESGETFEIERRFDLVELEAFVEDLIERYRAHVARIEAWRAERDRSIGEAPFPFPAYRTGQREMAVAVYRTIREGGELLVRAPTGAGKTHGALFPAVKALGEGETDRVFYLTARTTGRALAEGALAGMRQSGARIRAVTITAKEKICFNPEKACRGDECEFARGFYDRLPDAVADALALEALTRSGIEALARTHRVCPFELSLELTPLADVVIGDYNHAFDPRTRLRRFFVDGSPCSTLLVDEAHNLADRAREMFSASIARDSFLSLKRLFRTDSALVRSVGKVTASIGRACREEALPESEPPVEILEALSTFLAKAELAMESVSPGEAQRTLLERVFDAAWFARVAEGWDETYSTCYERQGRDRVVTLFCSDPASRLKETFDGVRATALFSATLSPAEYVRRSLGLSADCRALGLPPAFPRENLCVLIDEGIATTYRRRSATEEELAALLSRFVSHRAGNYLVYFPSYEYLRAVERRFTLDAPGAELHVQEPGMPEAARDAFLEKFSTRRGTVVGFAVMGGVFGEGIDLPGERLEGVAVVGVGLPALGAKRDLIRKRFDREGRGFDYAYVFPGMNRVLQAAGRVIRSDDDRGAVLLIDARFRERRYRSLLPREWSPRFIRGPEELGRELARFWNG